MLQYTAVGIQSDVWTCYNKSDFKRNLDRLAFNISRAVRYAELDLPVRLVALSEGALGGWASWAGGTEEHIRTCRQLAPEIPGEETDFLGQLCREGDFYLIGQMQAKDVELMEDRIFNTAFIIDPKGEIIHKHHKTHCFGNEPMTQPTDIWDRYVEKYGDDPTKLFEALFPVARTEIGNIGTLICAEGSFPEAARALALNGAEIIWRAQYTEPHLSNGMFEVTNRSHAIFNSCYVIAPCLSEVFGYRSTDSSSEVSEDYKISWGQSRMYDYRGNLMSQCFGTGQTFVSGILNIDGLRDFRVRGLWVNFAKELRIEQYKVIYDAMMAKGGMYPRNMCMEEPPLTEADQHELLRYNMNRAVELGIYTPPQGWKPHTIKKEVLKRIEKTMNRG
jgi:predicted amidohydrolase